jgi:hypothetical protein
MAQVTIDTVTYPSWWSSVTTVFVVASSAGYYVPREGVELLPEGVSFQRPSDSQHVLFPWAQITRIESA